MAPRTDPERINEASCAGGIKADVGSSTGLQFHPSTVKSSFITCKVPSTVPQMHFASFPSQLGRKSKPFSSFFSFKVQCVKFLLYRNIDRAKRVAFTPNTTTSATNEVVVKAVVVGARQSVD